MSKAHYTRVKPFPDESIFSWITRISNLELLSKPTKLYYKMFRLTRLGPEASHNIVNAIQSDDINQETVQQMRYFDGAGKFLYRGIPVRRIHLRMHSPQICPACIREFGYAKSFWDLRVATTCHIHQVSLTDTCPGCNKLIRWLRPSLSRCTCSAHLDRITTLDSPKLAQFNELIYSLHHKDYEPSFSNPIYKIIQQGSVADVINVIEKFGNNFYTGRSPHSKDYDIKPYSAKHPKFFKTLVTVFIDLLEDWPNAFLKFIDDNFYSLRATGVEKSYVQKFFSQLALLNSPLSREFEKQLGIHLASNTKIRPSKELSDALIAGQFNPTIINVASAAKLMNVKTEHILNYLSSGLARHISPYKEPALSSAVYFSELNKSAFANNSLTPISKLLQELGISKFLLKQLQKRGQLKNSYFGRKQYNSISSADYKEFISSLLHNATQITEPKGYKSLKSILSDRFITESFRADLIGEIQAGHISVKQLADEKLSSAMNIYINRKDLKNFKSARTQANKDKESKA